MKHDRAPALQPAPLTYAQRVRYVRGLKRDAYHRQGRICLYCLDWMSLREATTEHRKPKSRGGEDVPTNIDAACSTCNNAKGSLTRREFELAIFRPSYKRHPWKLYLACLDIRLKRRINQAVKRLARAA